jgi:hypothetical protein
MLEAISATAHILSCRAELPTPNPKTLSSVGKARVGSRYFFANEHVLADSGG